MKKNYYKDHQILLKQCLKALQKKYPLGRFFERHVGMFYRRNGIPIKINQKGMADVWGVVDGVHIEIEFKTGKARQTKEQKSWEKVVKSFGGKYYVIRDVKEIECLFQTDQAA
jgi:hypothetical protein